MSKLIISHAGTKGGAGKYNENLARAAIKSCSKVCVCGKLPSSLLNSASNKSRVFKFFNSLWIPHYSGVNFLRFLYMFVLSFIKLPIFLTRIRKSASELSEFDCFVFTSSVQVFEAFILKLILPDKKVTIVVQENARFKILGFFRFAFFYKNLKVISITKVWKDYALNYGIKSEVIRNPIELSEAVRLNAVDKWDFCYVGGSSKIKGYNKLVEVLRCWPSDVSMRIVMLGSYSDEEVRELNLLSDNCSALTIDCFGLVEDATFYIANSKVLVCPIQSPHFCRPIIESALAKRTFIIPDFQELNEFAKSDCGLKYKPTEIDDSLLRFMLEILSDDELRIRLSLNNYKALNGEYDKSIFYNNVKEALAC